MNNDNITTQLSDDMRVADRKGGSSHPYQYKTFGESIFFIILREF